LRSIAKKGRQEWFAARVNAVKSWPHRTSEQILDDASLPAETKWFVVALLGFMIIDYFYLTL
jgi:hypothetical protein